MSFHYVLLSSIFLVQAHFGISDYQTSLQIVFDRKIEVYKLYQGSNWKLILCIS